MEYRHGLSFCSMTTQSGSSSTNHWQWIEVQHSNKDLQKVHAFLYTKTREQSVFKKKANFTTHSLSLSLLVPIWPTTHKSDLTGDLLVGPFPHTAISDKWIKQAFTKHPSWPCCATTFFLIQMALYFTVLVDSLDEHSKQELYNTEMLCSINTILTSKRVHWPFVYKRLFFFVFSYISYLPLI